MFVALIGDDAVLDSDCRGGLSAPRRS